MANLSTIYDYVGGSLTRSSVAGDGGEPKLLPKLAHELNRKGSKWGLCSSNPTSSSVRYKQNAMLLCETSKVKK